MIRNPFILTLLFCALSGILCVSFIKLVMLLSIALMGDELPGTLALVSAVFWAYVWIKSWKGETK